MGAGKLKDKVIIQSKSSRKDEYGARLKQFDKVYAAKGDVRYLAGSDLIKAGVELNMEVITVKMRLDSRLKHNHSLFVDDERFDVGSIKPTDNKRYMIVTATRDL